MNGRSSFIPLEKSRPKAAEAARQRRGRSLTGFTLIELLVVIAILGVLATVVVLVLNPAEIIRQARDSTRLKDLQTINKVLGFIQVDQPSASFGSTSTVYVSIPDTSATCANLGFPTLPTGWSYACTTEENFRKVDSTGWIPVNFTSFSAGSPLSKLPVDPINTSSSGSYHTYIPGGSWELATVFESQKYMWKILNDGGSDAFRYEAGTDLSLAGLSLGTEILVNGGMESASGGLASSWSNVVGGGGTITPADAEPANTISGTRTQKLTIVTGAGGSGLRQDITVVCNGIYRARIFYKSGITGGTPAFIGVYNSRAEDRTHFSGTICRTTIPFTMRRPSSRFLLTAPERATWTCRARMPSIRDLYMWMKSR